ncbi:uncharacterized protein LOC109857328 isoform X2 [Pseudomyrmex gracilis]|uniref:uncharacterized protein LOC109857328 isoform X2 n=1 Tax=Pseudomyrmex gracilis TaxID=219809 RepID=UPI000994B9DC|nr:uncharacterized protein LOC109857328 isoform X2 [Pseudomyrmex gracilis]
MCCGTKLYMAILKNHSQKEWTNLFGEAIRVVVELWESEAHKNRNALQSLVMLWLEPTIKKNKHILLFLWDICKNTQGYFFRSHVLRMAAKYYVNILYEMHEIERYAKDKDEIVRLNAFVVLCYRVVDLFYINEADPLILIKQFLWFNANTASNFVRKEMIKYFEICCSKIFKLSNFESDHTESVCKFMDWLHEYFLDCFEIGSCYQRKILALNLYRTLLSFTHTNSEQNLKITDNWKFTEKKYLFVLLRLVLDSALDIRQLATTLILQYFEKDVLSPTEKRVLYICGRKHYNSFKFYEIESGAALMKIMAHWLPLNEPENVNAIDVVFSDDAREMRSCYQSYSHLLLDETTNQLAEMKSDILKAVVQEKPFYGPLSALLAIAFRAGPESWIVTSEFTEKLLNLSRDAVDFFLSALSTKTSNTAYSSSFAEMGLAIDEKIKSSEVNDSDYNELLLSPAHQVLLSCIWMSLKVLCKTVSEIGMAMLSDTQVKCSIDIIATVLLKCRHKGVMECAGVAIADLSRCLYNRKEYCKLPEEYLTHLLKDDAGQSLHLTRRGAGLSIMFHKLVVSDNRSNRPMVHLAIQMLLCSLENFSMDAVRNVEDGQDSPWAKRLHFLRTLIIDKDIHVHLVPYMETICLTCFKYMESDVWTVRNASLQLYGALVPRLVGQHSGRDDETLNFGTGYSVNHFVTHHPIVTSRMWTQLRDVSKLRGTSNATLRAYSSVVPILILLSELSVGGSDLIDYPTEIFTTKIKPLLFVFLGNPMMCVRQLAAKAYAALTPFKKIISEMDMLKIEILSNSNINLLHGFLLTRKYLREKYCELIDLHSDDCDKFDPIELIDSHNSDNYNKNIKNKLKFASCEKSLFRDNRYARIIKVWNEICNDQRSVSPCYMLEILFLQETEFVPSHYESMYHLYMPLIKVVTPSQKIQPGLFQFIGYWARMYAYSVKHKFRSEDVIQFGNNDSWSEVVHHFLHSSCIEESVEFLRTLSYCPNILGIILNYLTSIKNNCHQLLLDEIITFTLNTVKRTSLKSIRFEFDKIIERFNESNAIASSYTIRVRNSLILAFSKSEIFISEVLSHVFCICTDAKQSTRWIATEYLELALQRFAQLNSYNKLTIMRCCLIMLKDEVDEIRDVVSTLLQKYAGNNDQLQHVEIVYQQLLLDTVRLQFDIATVDDIVNFTRYFTHAVRDVDSNSIIENPFIHDDSTLLREESKFLNMCFLYNPSSCDYRIRENNLNPVHAIQMRYFRILQEKAGLDYDDLQGILSLRDMDYLSRKRDVLQWK